MTKRFTKAEAQLIAVVIIIVLPIYVITQIGEYVGWSLLVGIVVTIVAFVVVYKIAQKRKRRRILMDKYNDESLVDKLMDRSVWQGQTSEQLLDSLGHPEIIDEKILKTKKKEIWKYNRQGRNRYGLKITLDNDIVVGWDYKT